jgi:hypothetical protein
VTVGDDWLTEGADDEVPVLPVVPVVPVLPVLPLSLPKFEPLPQPTSSAAKTQATIDNLRMSFILARQTIAGVSRDLNLPAKSLA